jgi:uncharacterized protein
MVSSEGNAKDMQDQAMDEEISVRDLVEEIAKALVDDPAQVTVAEVAGEQNTSLELRVAPGDMGKVIGKQGRTARSLRTLVGAVSTKLDKRYSLEILE